MTEYFKSVFLKIPLGANLAGFRLEGHKSENQVAETCETRDTVVSNSGVAKRHA